MLRTGLLRLKSGVARKTAVSRVGSASAQELLIAIRALLERSGLPTSDLESARPEFAVLGENGQVIAAGALRRCGVSARRHSCGR